MPQNPGVYLFKNNKGKVIYVGKAKDLKKRVFSYFRKTTDYKTSLLVKEIRDISFIVVESEVEAFLLEANLIKRYKPFYNIKLADDKFFPYIIISKSEIPYVSITRKKSEKNSYYFGPYTDASSLKAVFRTVRKIFPFQSVKNHPKKKCFYNHLGLCPCINVFPEKKEDYRKNIKKIKKFFSGKTAKIILELTKERNNLSKKEEFEKAKLIQEKIDKIVKITSVNFNIQGYDKNSNYFLERAKNETVTLIEILSPFFSKLDNLDRIECYDVSNIQGNSATGSMVVFINGIAQKKDYRRFKIKTRNKPNDFAMIHEIVKRRLGHPEWPWPKLMVIDGGQGQVRYALKALSGLVKNIAVIGLAKENEEIIIPNFEKSKIFYVKRKLPLTNPGINLLRRLRDEAHRFAISYHRKLRSKIVFDRFLS